MCFGASQIPYNSLSYWKKKKKRYLFNDIKRALAQRMLAQMRKTKKDVTRLFMHDNIKEIVQTLKAENRQRSYIERVYKNMLECHSSRGDYGKTCKNRYWYCYFLFFFFLLIIQFIIQFIIHAKKFVCHIPS